MSVNSRAEQYEKVFGDWTLNKTAIGQGSNGKTAVFELTKANRTFNESCAMKVVNIVEHKGKRNELSETFLEDYENYKEELCEKAENEIKLMNTLGGSLNIVSYHDYVFRDWEDENGFGTDLLIRMDMLKSIGDIRKERTFAEDEIIKMGIQIASALDICHKSGIIHRDIKPDNIFINSFGNYLLGDFGISKMMNNSSSAETRTGTESYAAPEQFIGNYGSQVDIYSLGLSMYELANGNKLPFARTAFVGTEEIKRRLRGDEIPRPENVSEQLGNIILKACAYKSTDRYQKASELREELQKLQDSRTDYVKEQAVNTNNSDTKEFNTDKNKTDASVKEQQPEEVQTKYNNIFDKDKAEEHERIQKEYEKKKETDPYATVPALSEKYIYSDKELPDNDEIIIKQESRTDNYSDLLGLEDIELKKINYNEIDIDAAIVGRNYFERGWQEKAVGWYRRSKSPEAVYELAYCTGKGYGVAKDIEIAINMFTGILEQISDEKLAGKTMYNMACLYEELGNRKYRKTAENWFRSSANLGNQDALKRFHNGKFIKNTRGLF